MHSYLSTLNLAARNALLLSTLLAFGLHAASAPLQEVEWQQDDWGDDWETEPASAWKFNGFVEGALGAFTQSQLVDSAYSMQELRTRLEYSYSHELFEFNGQADAHYDGVLDEIRWQTRTAYVSTSPTSSMDVKVGRQVLTWGTGDYLFLNDLFAKDWTSFFSGRDDEYLKAPSDSLRVSWYFDNVTMEVAWTPEFTPDNYLTGERFSFYSPQFGGLIAPTTKPPVQQTNGSQTSLRLATSVRGIEFALYGYSGYWTTPVGVDDMGLGYFPKMSSWGASARLPLASGLFNTEFAYYNSIEDGSGLSPTVPNSQSRLLFGYEQELITNLTAGVQLYFEKTEDYGELRTTAPAVEILPAEFRQLATLRLTYRAMQQKLIWSLFGFYSRTDEDAYTRLSVSYRQDDKWSYVAGANVFAGKDDFSVFGQHEKNSNVWLRIRYRF